jgi:hypothetical protein
MGVIQFRPRKIEIDETILKIEDNVIYVDFVLLSLVNSIETWYKKYYHNDSYNLMVKAHVAHIIRFYDAKRFTNHDILGEERQKYLEEIDLYVQMRRED